MAANTYRIGEAADLLQLKSYVLRFWETEFTQLAPLRTDKGQRLYTEEHVELLRRIRHLLHEQGMTIDGARRVLTAELKHGAHIAKASSGANPSAVQSATQSRDVPVVSATSATSATSVDLAGLATLGRPAVPHEVEPFVPAASVHSAPAPDSLRLVRDELLELRNLLLSQ